MNSANTITAIMPVVVSRSNDIDSPTVIIVQPLLSKKYITIIFYSNSPSLEEDIMIYQNKKRKR
jgi:hypothetical protein